MKLGVAYNAFNDGLEHLQESINSIRDHVDYIAIVYQDISNRGESVPFPGDVLKQFNSKFYFVPNLKLAPGMNELEKRNIGLSLCKSAGCTHFLSIDCDEIYNSEKFKNAKQIIANENYDSSVCKTLTYYKFDSIILDPPEEHYVPFIYKIRNHVKFQYGLKWPVLADPTRRQEHGKMKIFTEPELLMHHKSWIRQDMNLKLRNSSANIEAKIIDDCANWYNSYQAGPALITGKFWNTRSLKNGVNR